MEHLLVLEHAPDVLSRYSYGTPIHRAAYQKSASTLQLLLEKGADVNSKDDANQTPLHMAALSGQKLAMQLLLDRGADTNIRDLHNQTPFDLVG